MFITLSTSVNYNLNNSYFLQVFTVCQASSDCFMNSISFNPHNNSEEDNIIYIFIVEKNQGKEHLAQGHSI